MSKFPLRRTKNINNYNWESLEFHFSNFRELSEEKVIQSKEFKCLGHKWLLLIFPGGAHNVTEELAAVSLYLCSKGRVNVSFAFSVKGHDCCTEVEVFHKFCNKQSKLCLRPLSNIHWALINGTFTIEARLRRSNGSRTKECILQNPFQSSMHGISFMNKDVTFEVSGTGSQTEKSTKRVKMSPVTFSAHHSHLQKVAPALAALCKANTNRAPVPITDVEPKIFGYIMDYIYGKTLPEDELKTYAKDIIYATNKYGIAGLKILAEEIHVRSIMESFSLQIPS